MPKLDLIPLYYEGQNRATKPKFLKTRIEIKLERKAGLLNGSYQENGAIFIVYQAREADPTSAHDHWIPLQSGYAGPLVLQLV